MHFSSVIEILLSRGGWLPVWWKERLGSGILYDGSTLRQSSTKVWWVEFVHRSELLLGKNNNILSIYRQCATQLDSYVGFLYNVGELVKGHSRVVL